MSHRISLLCGPLVAVLLVCAHWIWFIPVLTQHGSGGLDAALVVLLVLMLLVWISMATMLANWRAP